MPEKFISRKYKINREKCIGCGICLANCPETTKLEENGKAKVINQEK